MKKVLCITFICLLFISSACTLIQNLVVVNSSEEEVELNYGFKDDSQFLPEITSEENFNRWKIFQKDWEKISTEQFIFDQPTKTYKVKMRPHQVVKIGFGDPYYLDQKDDKFFNIKELRISGKNKQIYFEQSSKLLDEFVENGYRITYR